MTGCNHRVPRVERNSELVTARLPKTLVDVLDADTTPIFGKRSTRLRKLLVEALSARKLLSPKQTKELLS